MLRLVMCRLTDFNRIFYKSYVDIRYSHYDSLGVSRNATQAEIKEAYYKKSMMYHPDKNKGEEAAKNFRAITTAYEVLGNLRLRKKYDKGILPHEDEILDSSYETELPQFHAFYKSRLTRDRPPTAGKTNVYNYEEWRRVHYGQIIKHRKSVSDDRKDDKESVTSSIYVSFGITAIFLLCYHYFSTVASSPSRDSKTDRRKPSS